MSTLSPADPVVADQPAGDGRRNERYGDVVARLAAAQKHSVGAPAYSRFVNRPLGRRIAAVAYLLGLTPNAVTAISALLSFSGIAIIALVPPAWWTGVLVAVLLVLGYAFDAADGQLARLRGGGSSAGEWLDHVVDAGKISALHLAVLIGAFRFFDLGSAAWLLIPIGFVLVANVTFFGMILNDLLRARLAAKTGTPVVRSAAPSTLRSLLVIPTDYGVMCLVFVLLGAPVLFFGVYTALFAANAAFLLLALVKWFRDMAALDVPAVKR
jgi:phosphatidylglycerophosphate synthase